MAGLESGNRVVFSVSGDGEHREALDCGACLLFVLGVVATAVGAIFVQQPCAPAHALHPGTWLLVEGIVTLVIVLCGRPLLCLLGSAGAILYVLATLLYPLFQFVWSVVGIVTFSAGYNAECRDLPIFGWALAVLGTSCVMLYCGCVALYLTALVTRAR